MAAQPQPLNWAGISVEKEWEPRPKCTIFLDCSIDDPIILKNDVFLEGELSIFENDLKDAVHIGLDFEQCLDEDGSTTFVLIVTFVDNRKREKQHSIFLYKVLRLNERKRKLRPLADMWKDMTQAKVSLSQNGAREIIKKIFGDEFLDGFEYMTITEMLDQFKSDWFLSEPPNPSPGEQMEYATASSGSHSFKINATEVLLASRDCGPKPTEVIPQIQMLQILRSQRQQVPFIIQHLLSLFNAGNNNPPVFITTAGNTLDPATNPPGCSLYSLLFVNFRKNFLSGFNGLNPEKYILRLLTHRDDSDVSAPNQKFHCDLNIGVRDKGTIACFNGFSFDMRSNVMNGGIDGTNASIQYDNNVYTQRNGGVKFTKNSVSKEFALSIGGNNEKNAQLIKLLTAAPTPQMNAKMLSAIILKGFGDPNQLLFNIADVLYYSLLRFQEFLKLSPDIRAQSTIKTLHGFFIDTLSKCLLITCDGMLARLAVAFRFPVALQKGNSVVQFRFKETDEVQKARCAFITKKESAKNKMNAALKLLAKCGNYMSLYLITSSGTTPFLANTNWFNLSDMIKNISGGIIKHIDEIDGLVVANTANPLGDPNHISMLKQIEICEKLYSESLVTKNTTSVLGSSGQSRIVYHINYKMALAIAAQPFLVRTKKCHKPELAELEPDFLDAMRFRGNAADVDAAAVDAAAAATATVNAPSAANAVANAPSAANATVNAPSAAVDAPSAANATVNAPSAANAATVNAPSAANATVNAPSAADAAPEHDNDLKNTLIVLTASKVRNPNRCKVDRSHLARSVRGTYAGGSGGKSNKYIQRGGQKPDSIEKNVEALVGPTFLMNRNSMSIPFIQRNVLLFLYLLYKTQYQPLIKQYLSTGINESNLHLITIDETIREFIAVLTTLENNKTEEDRLKAEAEAKKKVDEERLKAEAEAKKKAEKERSTQIHEKIKNIIQQKKADLISLNARLQDLQRNTDPISNILFPVDDELTAKRLVRDEDLADYEKGLSTYKSEYQKLEHDVSILEIGIESLSHYILYSEGKKQEPPTKPEENDEAYRILKDKVKSETDGEIQHAVQSLIAQSQQPVHVSPAEGEIQLPAGMTEFANIVDNIVDHIIDNLLKTPHANIVELSVFVNRLLDHNSGKILSDLYLSLFENLETQSKVSLSKSPERFLLENTGVTLSDSLEASIAREFPDESPTNVNIHNGMISYSIEPKRVEQIEEVEGGKEGEEMRGFSPQKPLRRVQSMVNTPVNFDVSILLELIESMICDLLSFDKIEIPEIQNSSSEGLLHKLQSIELLILDHETNTRNENIYTDLHRLLHELRSLMNEYLLQHEQSKTNAGNTNVQQTASEEGMGSSADSPDEEISVPSFIDYIKLSIHALRLCLDELNLVVGVQNGAINLDTSYTYIHPSSDPLQVVSPSPTPMTPYSSVSDVSPLKMVPLALWPSKEVLDRMDTNLSEGGESQNVGHNAEEPVEMTTDGGGRPITKKPTRRKPRRNTRNYQSHNKRKHRSNKKSTVKHRKSYRKHNRTIKRRKNSRRRNQ